MASGNAGTGPPGCICFARRPTPTYIHTLVTLTVFGHPPETKGKVMTGYGRSKGKKKKEKKNNTTQRLCCSPSRRPLRKPKRPPFPKQEARRFLRGIRGPLTSMRPLRRRGSQQSFSPQFFLRQEACLSPRGKIAVTKIANS